MSDTDHLQTYILGNASGIALTLSVLGIAFESAVFVVTGVIAMLGAMGMLRTSPWRSVETGIDQ